MTPRHLDDVKDWDFGKMSALREIDLALQGGYRYYYMGKKKSFTTLKTIILLNYGFF